METKNKPSDLVKCLDNIIGIDYEHFTYKEIVKLKMNYLNAKRKMDRYVQKGFGQK